MTHFFPDSDPSPYSLELAAGDYPPFVEEDTWKVFRDQLYRLPHDAVVAKKDLVLRIGRSTSRTLIEAVGIRTNQAPVFAIIDIDGRDALIATVRSVNWLSDSTGSPADFVIPHSGTIEMNGETEMRLVAEGGFQFLTEALQQGRVASRCDGVEFGIT